MIKIRCFFVVTFCFAISGCATPTHWVHPNYTDEEKRARQFAIDDGRCIAVASGSVSMPAFSAPYSNYVSTFQQPSFASGFSSGLAQGAAIGAAMRAKENRERIYRGCMLSLGWSDEKSPEKTAIEKVENSKIYSEKESKSSNLILLSNKHNERIYFSGFKKIGENKGENVYFVFVVEDWWPTEINLGHEKNISVRQRSFAFDCKKDFYLLDSVRLLDKDLKEIHVKQINHKEEKLHLIAKGKDPATDMAVNYICNFLGTNHPLNTHRR